jgi:hypothetical protein
VPTLGWPIRFAFFCESCGVRSVMLPLQHLSIEAVVERPFISPTDTFQPDPVFTHSLQPSRSPTIVDKECRLILGAPMERHVEFFR